VVETNGPAAPRAKSHNDDTADEVISPHGDIRWLYPPTYTTNTTTTAATVTSTATKAAATTARKPSMTDLLFDSSMMWRQRFPKTSPKKSSPSGFHVFQDEESSSESSVASDASSNTSHDGFGSASSHVSSASSSAASTASTMDGIPATLGVVTNLGNSGSTVLPNATTNPTTAALRSTSLMSTRDLEP
jgi:hypothetical protein